MYCVMLDLVYGILGDCSDKEHYTITQMNSGKTCARRKHAKGAQITVFFIRKLARCHEDDHKGKTKASKVVNGPEVL